MLMQLFSMPDVDQSVKQQWAIGACRDIEDILEIHDQSIISFIQEVRLRYGS